MKISKFISSNLLSLILSLLLPIILHIYYYPWLYNKINYYTERGDNLNDKIDLLNITIVFIITWILVIIFMTIIASPLIFYKSLRLTTHALL